MRTRVLVAAAALLAVTLSGCSEANYLNPYGAPADDETPVDAGNETDNGTAPPAENETPAPPAAQGTLTITAPANFTVNETFTVELNFYYPGNEPRPAVYGNSTGNSTGNQTGDGSENRTVVDPGHAGTPAYHNDVWWVLNVTQGDVTVSFNGTSVPAVVDIALNVTMNATLEASYSRGDVQAIATVGMTAVSTSTVPVYEGPDPLVFTGRTTGFDPLAGAGEGCWISYEAIPTGAGYNMGGDRGGWTYVFANPSTHMAVFYDSANTGSTGEGTGGQVPAGSHYVDVCARSGGASGADYRLTIYPPGHPDNPSLTA